MADPEFGPYVLLRRLGQGGMGEVWVARDTSQDDRIVALKLLGGWLADDPAYIRRFRRESALAARLGNPHIVPIHRYGDIDGRLYIDMHLIDGIDLATHIATAGPLAPDVAVTVVVHAGRALTAAHRAGLVHRDVKPSNIVLSGLGPGPSSGDSPADDELHAYLIDFGVALPVDAAHASPATGAIGTPTYMAPERFMGAGDHRSDIYALGCVLQEALTGRAPFTTTNPFALLHAHHHATAPLPSSLRGGLPAGLDAVVCRALAKAPADRFATVSDFTTAARDALTPSGRARVAARSRPDGGTPIAAPARATPGHGVPVVAQPRPEPAGRRSRWWTTRRTAVAAAVTVGVVIAGSAILGATMSGGTPQPAPPPVLAARQAETVIVPDDDRDGIRQSVTLSAPGPVRRIILDLRIDHSDETDLQVRLVAPDGRSALVWDRDGTPGEDDIRLNLDSANARGVQGRQLAGLVGVPISGPWTLQVTDVSEGATGRLVGWSISVQQ